MNTFSSDWWRLFLDETHHLSKPKLFTNVLDQEIVQLGTLVVEVFQHIHENPPGKVFRFWIDGVQISEDQIQQKFVPPKFGEALANWIGSCYPSKRVGIILNDCQNYSEALKTYISSKIHPLFNLYGMPTQGIEITFFVGNYENTPLGVHLDPPGHKVIHFHIGPSPKEMYLLAPEVYENDLRSITQAKSGFQDFEKIKSHFTRYLINPGDLFFMPNGFYHIGRTLGFSAGITIWYENLKVERLAEKLVKMLAKRMFTQENFDIISSDMNFPSDVSHLVANVEKMMSSDTRLKEVSVMTIIRQLLLEYKLALYSNNFYNLESSYFNKLESQLKDNDIVVGKEPFKLYHTTEGDQAHIFIQGQKFSFPTNERLVEVIDDINSFRKIRVSELICPISDEWSHEVCLFFVNELYRRNAFDLVKENQVKILWP